MGAKFTSNKVGQRSKEGKVWKLKLQKGQSAFPISIFKVAVIVLQYEQCLNIFTWSETPSLRELTLVVVFGASFNEVSESSDENLLNNFCG